MLPLLLATAAYTQTVPPDPRDLPGPWEQMLELHRQEQFPWPKWRVLTRAPLDAGALRTEPILRLLSSGELDLAPSTEKEIAALWEEREWRQDIGWALLSPDGGLAATGAGAPSREALESALQKSGWQSRGARFATFSKREDGAGEAWGDALLDAGQLRIFTESMLKADSKKPLPWWVWEAPPPDPMLVGLKEKAEKEWIAALGGLRRHKGYERWPGLAAALALAPEKPPQSMRDALRPLLDDLLQALRKAPQSEALWQAWSQVARRLPMDVSEFTPSLFAVPDGDPWPPPAGLRAVLPLLKARGDLRVLVAFCRNQLQAPYPASLASEGAWRQQRLQRIQDWGLPGLEALVALKAEGDGLVWIDDLHEMWGKDWVTSNLRAFLRRVDQEWLPDSWDRALRSEPLEDPPLPQDATPFSVPFLALDSQHDRALEKGWKALRDSPALDAWGPGDLRWTSLSKAQLKGFRDDFGLDAKPRWFLFQGRALSASGTGAPDPLYIQERLMSLRVPRLEILDTFLSSHPEQDEARIERFRLLRDRLPQPRLEAAFRQDAEATLSPVTPVGGWSPSSEAWSEAAQRVLPRLEERIRNWPSDLGAWKAWVAWSEISPRKPSALVLSATLDPWPGLRFETRQLIASQLRNRGEWKALQRFAQDRWDALLDQVRPIHPAIPPLDPRLAGELDVWLSFLQDAFVAQGQPAAVKPLQAKYRELTLRKPPGH